MRLVRRTQDGDERGVLALLFVGESEDHSTRAAYDAASGLTATARRGAITGARETRSGTPSCGSL